MALRRVSKSSPSGLGVVNLYVGMRAAVWEPWEEANAILNHVVAPWKTTEERTIWTFLTGRGRCNRMTQVRQLVAISHRTREGALT